MGILTNSGARNCQGRPTLNIFLERNEFQLKAVFFPEHEIGNRLTFDDALSINEKHPQVAVAIPFSDKGEKIFDEEQLKKRGIEVYHTHTPNRRSPDLSWLEGLDVVVIDLQDIGIRYYTYSASMLHMMSACFNKGIEVMILDRPNPLGNYIGGPLIHKNYLSFLGMIEGEPLFHGMTIAEKARYVKMRKKDFEMQCQCGAKDCYHSAFCSARNLEKGKLTVIKMRGWHRQKTLTQLGLYDNDSSIALSPHIQDVASIFDYAIISLATLVNNGSIGFLTMVKLPQSQRFFQYISTVLPVTEVLNKVKKECPDTKGCTLTPINCNGQDYLELSVDDISKTTPALLSLIFIAQAQEWVSKRDWEDFEKMFSSTQSPQSTSVSTNTSSSKVTLIRTGNHQRNFEALTLKQQDALRRMKWDRLTKLQKEQFRKHMGDEEMIDKLFNGELIDIDYFNEKWKNAAIKFHNETKKYYLY
ncbi:MAG: DUF1343 domain-containing protein [Puniceicoccales bacterium]|nr:DUF1343 domain-containing protein [Puniceicoccales bacterium]